MWNSRTQNNSGLGPKPEAQKKPPENPFLLNQQGLAHTTHPNSRGCPSSAWAGTSGCARGGWATLTAKQNADLFFNTRTGITGGAPILALFEKACPERQPKGGPPSCRRRSTPTDSTIEGDTRQGCQPTK